MNLATPSMNYNIVSLRALEPEDLELVYQIENDPLLWQWGANNVPYSHYTIRQYLETQHSDIYQDGQLRLVVMADGQAVGIIDLCDFSPLHQRAEVGIVILSSHHRRGIASEALRQLAEYATQHLHLCCLYAYVGKQNLPAQGLFRRMGYTETGRLPRWISGTQTAILFQLLP